MWKKSATECPLLFCYSFNLYQTCFQCNAMAVMTLSLTSNHGHDNKKDIFKIRGCLDEICIKGSHAVILFFYSSKHSGFVWQSQCFRGIASSGMRSMT